MENNRREDMVFVSGIRLWANFKKFWWICALLCIAMLVYGASAYNNNIKTSDLSEFDKMVIELKDDPNERIYVGTTEIQIEIDVKKYADSLGINVNDQTDDSIYSSLISKTVEYSNSLVTSGTLYDRINSKLSAQGYSALCTSAKYPGDVGYDQFEVYFIDDKTANLKCIGIGGLDRITAIAGIYAEEFCELLMQKSGFVNASVTSSPLMQFRYYAYGLPSDVDASEETFQATKEFYREHNEIAMGTYNEFNFTTVAMFKTSTLIKGVVGIIVGFFIIFIISVCDKKLRTREEIEHYFNGNKLYLGEFGKDKEIDMIAAVSIQEMCRKVGVNNLVVTTPGKAKNMDVVSRFASMVAKDDIKVSAMEGIESSADTVKAAAAADGIILLVTGGYDDMGTFGDALDRLETINGRLLGYVLNK